MAITINSSTDKLVSLDEYVDFIYSNVDLNDTDSIAESAPMLAALANNKDLVADLFNSNLENHLSGNNSAMYSPQSFVLAAKKGAQKNFYVRGNIWPQVSAQSNLRELEGRVFSYNIAHDHDFHFMTIGYWGSGYETHIYECDSDDIKGYIGEPVEMRLLEKTTLPAGKIMLYRPFRDIHMQLPPKELSISLNLMIQDIVPNSREQYFYDLDKEVLVGYPYGARSFNRSSIIQMASYVGNQETVQMLIDIAKADPIPRARVAALEGLMRLAPNQAAPLLALASTDHNDVVRTFAQSALRSDDSASFKLQFDDMKLKLGLGLRREISTFATPAESASQ